LPLQTVKAAGGDVMARTSAAAVLNACHVDAGQPKQQQLLLLLLLLQLVGKLAAANRESSRRC
jgi:hypothetical protein